MSAAHVRALAKPASLENRLAAEFRRSACLRAPGSL
jgi:hypothetical protein